MLFAALVFAACWTDNDPIIGDGTPRVLFSSETCEPTDTPPGAVGTDDQSPTSDRGEGEVFGSIFIDGEWPCTPWDHMEYWVSLAPETVSASLSPHDSILGATHAFRIMWEFWDINASDGPCNNSREPETTHPNNSLDSLEVHCVSPGVYRYSGPGRGGVRREFKVDYLGTIGAGNPIRHTTVDSVALAVGGTTSYFGYHDLMINTDVGNSNMYWDTAQIHIDVVASISDSLFSDDPAPTGTAASWFRVFVKQDTTTTNWHGSDHKMTMANYPGGRTLAKVFIKDSSHAGA